MTFKELFFKGEIPFEEIDRYTSRWNFSDETCTLAHYLGLNAEEEDVWISQSDEALEELLEKEKAAYAKCRTKILFTDLDGTLLDDSKAISQGNRSAADRALDAGHKIVLASGRALANVLPIADKLDLQRAGGYIVSYNGGQIYDCHAQRLLLNQTLSFDDVAAIFELADKAGIYCQTYEDGYVLGSREGEELDFYVKEASARYKVPENVPLYLMKEPNKLLLIDMNSKENLIAFQAALMEQFSDRLDSFFSNDHYLEVVPKGVSKGNALHFLCNYLNIPSDNSVAAGDYENDLPMIREAAVGVILANAPDFVKKEADFVTEKDNNHDGFAEVIERFIL